MWHLRKVDILITNCRKCNFVAFGNICFTFDKRMDFHYKYYCKNCGGLLLKSVRPIFQDGIEVVCHKSDCKTRQLVGESHSLLYDDLELQSIKRRFKAEKKLRMHG